MGSHLVPNHQELEPLLPKKSKRENSPFHNKGIVARFPDFLHQLCSGVIEHPLRLSFVAALLNKSGRVWRYDVGGCSLLEANGGSSRTMGKHGPALWCVAYVWGCVDLLSPKGQREPTPIPISWFHDFVILRSVGQCSTLRAQCA